MKILIELEGGLVRGVFVRDAAEEPSRLHPEPLVCIMDYDVEGADPDDERIVEMANGTRAGSISRSRRSGRAWTTPRALQQTKQSRRSCSGDDC